MSHSQIKKLCICGLLCAIGVIGGTFAIPVLGSRCCPMQSIINVVAAVVLGPWYGAAIGFVIALLRNLFGIGTLFAFPGSVFGAFMAGIFYRRFKNLIAVCIGECIGTGILSAIAAYPLATLLMGREAALFTYVGPFMTTAVCGSIIGAIFIFALKRTGALKVLTDITDK